MRMDLDKKAPVLGCDSLCISLLSYRSSSSSFSSFDTVFLVFLLRSRGPFLSLSLSLRERESWELHLVSLTLLVISYQEMNSWAAWKEQRREAWILILTINHCTGVVSMERKLSTRVLRRWRCCWTFRGKKGEDEKRKTMKWDEKRKCFLMQTRDSRHFSLPNRILHRILCQTTYETAENQTRSQRLTCVTLSQSHSCLSLFIINSVTLMSFIFLTPWFIFSVKSLA